MENIVYRNIPQVTLQFRDEQLKLKIKVYSSIDIFNLVLPFFNECMQHHEEINVLYLNNVNKVLGIHCVGVGSDTATPVNTKAILQGAILSNATSIVLIHNHPSGSLSPSREDDNCTDCIKKAAKLFNVSLLDHLIITDESYYSYSDEGRI